MKKLLLAILLCCSINVSAKTYIKTKALYWVGLLPNVQVETRMGGHFTFQGEVNASLWESVGDRPISWGAIYRWRALVSKGRI